MDTRPLPLLQKSATTVRLDALVQLSAQQRPRVLAPFATGEVDTCDLIRADLTALMAALPLDETLKGLASREPIRVQLRPCLPPEQQAQLDMAPPYAKNDAHPATMRRLGNIVDKY